MHKKSQSNFKQLHLVKSRYVEVTLQSVKSPPLSQVKVEITLQLVKSPSASWIISGWQALEKWPEVAVNGFRKSEF